MTRPGSSCLFGMASAAVRTFTRQTLTRVDDDEVWLPSTGTSLLVLAELPVLDVQRVVIERYSVDRLRVADDDGSAEGRFSWDAAGRIRRLDGGSWGRTYDPVWVTYSHGFDPVPDDVVGIVAGKVASFLTGTEANPGGLPRAPGRRDVRDLRQRAGTDVALGPGALTKTEKDALRDYRLGAVTVAVRTD